MLANNYSEFGLGLPSRQKTNLINIDLGAGQITACWTHSLFGRLYWSRTILKSENCSGKIH